MKWFVNILGENSSTSKKSWEIFEMMGEMNIFCWIYWIKYIYEKIEIIYIAAISFVMIEMITVIYMMII